MDLLMYAHHCYNENSVDMNLRSNKQILKSSNQKNYPYCESEAWRTRR